MQRLAQAGSFVTKSIEDLMMEFMQQLVAGNVCGAIQRLSRRRPSMSILDRNLVSTSESRRSTVKLYRGNLRPLSQLFSVFAACHELLTSNRRISQRHLFYQLINFFSNQQEVNETVLDASAVLNVPRYLLNIGAATRGVVAGKLSISEPKASSWIDCSHVGNVRMSFLFVSSMI